MTSSIYEFIGTKIRPIELASIIKRVLRINRKYFLISGNYWYLDPVSNFGLRLLKEKHYEPEITDRILNKLQEGDVFVDLGANEGYYSILASKKVGRNGMVYCIEPQERLWGVILKNINKNNCYNIDILPYAVSEKREEVSITLSPTINSGSSTIVNEKRRKFWKRQRLNCTTLDELFYLNDFLVIKLMKVDIEGYEFFALKGAVKLLEKKMIKNIVIEFHPLQLSELQQSAQQIYDFLNKYGYTEINGVFTCE